MKKYLLIALTIGFGLIAFVAFQNAKPGPKVASIYQKIKPYSPYYIDKRFGGLRILSKVDQTFEEKPSNIEVFHRLDSLEKAWGKNHLRIEKETLIVTDSNNSTIMELPIQTPQELAFLHNFYGI